MRKIVLFEHDGGELANQLWNYLSVAAYAFERGVLCENWSFFEYPGIFLARQKNWFVRTFFETQFRGYRKRKSAFKTRFLRKLYKLLVVFPVYFFSKHILVSREIAEDAYRLPPTAAPSPHLQELEQYRGIVYVANQSGTVFRNSEGIVRQREKLAALFAPSKEIETRVAELMARARLDYAHIIGVHIRQGDYVTFKGGKFAVPQKRVVEILNEFLIQTKYSKEETCFMITSDGPIDETLFEGLSISVSKENVGTDLFTLSACEVVIGSDSTLGHFAAYLGNVPHIIMKKDSMNWEYYKGKIIYFPNKYLTVMAY